MEQEDAAEPQQNVPAMPPGGPSQASVPERPPSLLSRLRTLFVNVLLRIGLRRRGITFNWKSLLKLMSPAMIERLRAILAFARSDTPFAWKSLLSWKVLVPAGLAVVLVVTAVVSVVLYRQREAERAEAGKQIQTASAVPVVHEAAFPDFSIDIKDAHGRYRFLQCDVTLEFVAAVEMTDERRTDIRRIIYLAARKKGHELIRVSDSGIRFKKEVHDDLRHLLGEGALKDVYITRYVLL
jgi:flagellar basal body-associated protein FliL